MKIGCRCRARARQVAALAGCARAVASVELSTPARATLIRAASPRACPSSGGGVSSGAGSARRLCGTALPLGARTGAAANPAGRAASHSPSYRRGNNQSDRLPARLRQGYPLHHRQMVRQRRLDAGRLSVRAIALAVAGLQALAVLSLRVTRRRRFFRLLKQSSTLLRRVWSCRRPCASKTWAGRCAPCGLSELYQFHGPCQAPELRATAECRSSPDRRRHGRPPALARSQSHWPADTVDARVDPGRIGVSRWP